ncbi:hypothetical protein KIPB_006198 [Kipferlia bialata]|uniref:Uncharacterized protein n=1 Tax=Kipferlia bialata TaxID=797122 RepID=A0A9K3CQT9_9EUKA|nr:hypothetical protein KIPB_001512 [Kipferlia bialata]GIQ84662.1 hypothetical protein KIPB_006198 [Kipferlia bialata]|eukprot:g1512.t1
MEEAMNPTDSVNPGPLGYGGSCPKGSQPPDAGDVLCLVPLLPYYDTGNPLSPRPVLGARSRRDKVWVSVTASSNDPEDVEREDIVGDVKYIKCLQYLLVSRYIRDAKEVEWHYLNSSSEVAGVCQLDPQGAEAAGAAYCVGIQGLIKGGSISIRDERLAVLPAALTLNSYVVLSVAALSVDSGTGAASILGDGSDIISRGTGTVRLLPALAGEEAVPREEAPGEPSVPSTVLSFSGDDRLLVPLPVLFRVCTVAECRASGWLRLDAQDTDILRWRVASGWSGRCSTLPVLPISSDSGTFCPSVPGHEVPCTEHRLPNDGGDFFRHGVEVPSHLVNREVVIAQVAASCLHRLGRPGLVVPQVDPIRAILGTMGSGKTLFMYRWLPTLGKAVLHVPNSIFGWKTEVHRGCLSTDSQLMLDALSAEGVSQRQAWALSRLYQTRREVFLNASHSSMQGSSPILDVVGSHIADRFGLTTPALLSSGEDVVTHVNQVVAASYARSEALREMLLDELARFILYNRRVGGRERDAVGHLLTQVTSSLVDDVVATLQGAESNEGRLRLLKTLNSTLSLPQLPVFVYIDEVQTFASRDRAPAVKSLTKTRECVLFLGGLNTAVVEVFLRSFDVYSHFRLPPLVDPTHIARLIRDILLGPLGLQVSDVPKHIRNTLAVSVMKAGGNARLVTWLLIALRKLVETPEVPNKVDCLRLLVCPTSDEERQSEREGGTQPLLRKWRLASETRREGYEARLAALVSEGGLIPHRKRHHFYGDMGFLTLLGLPLLPSVIRSEDPRLVWEEGYMCAQWAVSSGERPTCKEVSPLVPIGPTLHAMGKEGVFPRFFASLALADGNDDPGELFKELVVEVLLGRLRLVRRIMEWTGIGTSSLYMRSILGPSLMSADTSTIRDIRLPTGFELHTTTLEVAYGLDVLSSEAESNLAATLKTHMGAKRVCVFKNRENAIGPDLLMSIGEDILVGVDIEMGGGHFGWHYAMGMLVGQGRYYNTQLPACDYMISLRGSMTVGEVQRVFRGECKGSHCDSDVTAMYCQKLQDLAGGIGSELRESLAARAVSGGHVLMGAEFFGPFLWSVCRHAFKAN